jgi:hypothetical protein
MLDNISIITQECQSATVQTGQIHHLISIITGGDDGCCCKGDRSPFCRDPCAVFGPHCRRFSATVLACAVKTEEAATKGGNYK